MREEIRTPKTLRDKALGYRQEADALKMTLGYRARPEAARAKLEAERLVRMASDLERAAQRLEAVGV